MNKTKIHAMSSFFVLAVFLCVLPSRGDGATVSVDCSSASLQAGVDKAKPGDTVLVSGTCNENLVVPEHVQKITLDGQGKATISGTDKAKDTILVYGRGITIKGLTITGGRDGIQMLMGGTALVDGNTIEKVGRFGVYVTQHSSSRIVNNTIQNNGQFAISVSGSAFAYIGFLGYLDLMDKTTSPNVIQGNGRAGIHVHRTAYARIAGNTISNNKLNGIEVEGVSHAQIGGNTINGNGGDGIHISENSSVNLGSGKGTRILDLPNVTTAANKGFGISCSEGGSANGSLGSLNGAKGAKDFDNSCADRLRP